MASRCFRCEARNAFDTTGSGAGQRGSCRRAGWRTRSAAGRKARSASLARGSLIASPRRRATTDESRPWQTPRRRALAAGVRVARDPAPGEGSLGGIDAPLFAPKTPCRCCVGHAVRTSRAAGGLRTLGEAGPRCRVPRGDAHMGTRARSRLYPACAVAIERSPRRRKNCVRTASTRMSGAAELGLPLVARFGDPARTF